VLSAGFLQHFKISNDPIKANWMYCIIIQTSEKNSCLRHNYVRGKLYHCIATYLSEIMFKKMIE
jgi:hypothetical protein